VDLELGTWRAPKVDPPARIHQKEGVLISTPSFSVLQVRGLTEADLLTPSPFSARFYLFRSVPQWFQIVWLPFYHSTKEQNSPDSHKTSSNGHPGPTPPSEKSFATGGNLDWEGLPIIDVYKCTTLPEKDFGGSE
jgi:hypothetical protein